MFHSPQKPQQPNRNDNSQSGYREDDSIRHYKQENQRKKPNDSDFADYEEIK
jgi:hypothetical protein